MAHIKAGWGYHVGQDFNRAGNTNVEIELAPKEYAKPGNVIGYIAGDPKSNLGFMRAARVRVHVTKQAIGE
jgi:hypothetical protein